MSRPDARPRRGWPLLGALGLLYTSQGIPFGFATEYLPVALREQGYSYTAIAALGWLQLPWQLKVLWSKAADQPALVRLTREVLLGVQCLLAMAVAAFAIRPLAGNPRLWFALTFGCALLASTQDVFVDAFAVRVLPPEARGLGNTAQVAGYRLGMLLGGAALLLLTGALGERSTLLACAGFVLATSVGAFAASGHAGVSAVGDVVPTGPPLPLRALARHMLAPGARTVLATALVFKLGLHMASGLLKPMAVDFGWSRQEIGAAVVLFGSIGALTGAALGGVLHRRLGEPRALFAAMIAQALTCLPLVLVAHLGAPRALTTAVVFAEHFASGFGTTVLFAALMTATRPADAGVHYTVLTGANALAIGLGSMLGGGVADVFGKKTAFVAATLVCLVPLPLVRRWDDASRASAAR